MRIRAIIDARPADQARQDAVLLVHHPKSYTFPGAAPRTAENRKPPQGRSGACPATPPQEPRRFVASGAKARSFACSHPRGAQVRSYVLSWYRGLQAQTRLIHLEIYGCWLRRACQHALHPPPFLTTHGHASHL